MLLLSNGHSCMRLLRAMATLQTSVAVIITRLPDIITCLQVTDANSGQNAYVIFDPHPRPLHPDGAGLIFSSSLDNAANILGGILHVHKDRMSSSNLQWGEQLRTNCSGYFFVAKSWRRYTGKSVLKSSLTVLALRSAIKELQQQNDALSFRNGKHDEVATLEDASNQETLKATRATAVLSRQEHTQGRRDYYQLNAVAGPSQLPLHDRVPQYNGAQGVNPPPLPPRKLRNAFDAKDAVPRYQEASHLRKRFDCGICLEKCPEDDAARVDGCGHTMCRSCMKGFITAKIAEHRFPILCPICTVDNGGRPATGTHHSFECDQSCNEGTRQKFPVCLSNRLESQRKNTGSGQKWNCLNIRSCCAAESMLCYRADAYRH